MVRNPLSRRCALKFSACAIVAAGFSKVEAAPVGRVMNDGHDRRTLIGKADKIACIGGVLTEILYRLGASNRICAVDETSSWPPAALREKAHLGYMRMISAEGVLSLRPDLILTMDDAGPLEAFSMLEASSIPLFYVSAKATPEAALQRIEVLARLVDAVPQGNILVQEIGQAFKAVSYAARRARLTSKVLFVLHVMNNHLICGGLGTPADEAIRLCNVKNAASGFHGYKVMIPEALALLQPDVIVTMRENGAEVADIIKNDAALQITPAGRKGQIISVDGEALLTFGPRTPEALLSLLADVERSA